MESLHAIVVRTVARQSAPPPKALLHHAAHGRFVIRRERADHGGRVERREPATGAFTCHPELENLEAAALCTSIALLDDFEARIGLCVLNWVDAVRIRVGPSRLQRSSQGVRGDSCATHAKPTSGSGSGTSAVASIDASRRGRTAYASSAPPSLGNEAPPEAEHPVRSAADAITKRFIM